MTELSDSDFQLIEAKIDGTLSEQQQVEFDQKIKDSVDFRQEYQMQQSLIYSLVHENNESIKKDLYGFLDETKNLDHKKPNYLGIAASVSILLVCGLLYYFISENSPDNTSLYQAYYQAYPAPSVKRGEEVTDEVDFTAYRKGDFTQAINELESTSKKDRYTLYLAICYIETNQSELAKKQLQSIATTDNPMLSQTAEWYLALVYLKENNLEKCRQHLQKIVTGKQLYNKQAGELIDQVAALK